MISRAAWLCSKKFAGDESRSIPSVDHPGDGRGMICIRKTKSPASPAGTAGSYGGIFVRISFSTRSHPGLAGGEQELVHRLQQFLDGKRFQQRRVNLQRPIPLE